jgi:hypothetical protein
MSRGITPPATAPMISPRLPAPKAEITRPAREPIPTPTITIMSLLAILGNDSFTITGVWPTVPATRSPALRNAGGLRRRFGASPKPAEREYNHEGLYSAGTGGH